MYKRQTLLNAMSLESLRETDRRRVEAAHHGALTSARDRCAALAREWGARAWQRVPIQRQVAHTEQVTVWDRVPHYVTRWVPYQTWERVPVRHWYRTRRRYGWHYVWGWQSRIVMETRLVTRHRAETHLEWRYVARTITRTVWRTETVWVTRYDPWAAIQAAAYQVCANAYAGAAAAHERDVRARRAVWDRQWSELVHATHDAWKVINTRCRTIREEGAFDVQRCDFGAWRIYEPGGFERRIRVPETPPPPDVIRRARDIITPPGPVIRLSPRVEWEQIVHLPTWMWIDPGAWRARTARADAGRAWAEATATPTRVVWDMGNGDRVTCEGPGTPYDEARPGRQQRSDCTYTYPQSSAGLPNDAYTVTATLIYDVTWSGSGGAGGDLGTITTRSSEAVRVAEIQALVTDSR